MELGNRPTERLRLLLVEDDKLQQKLYALHLEREGFDVVFATTVQSAVEQARQEKFAIAVIDLGLGESNGLDLIRELSVFSPETRLIVYTSMGNFDAARDSVNLGVFGFVEKSNDPQLLIKFVHRAAEAFLQANLFRAENEIRFQLRLLDAVEHGVVAVNLRLETIYWNRFAEKLTGLQASDVIGKNAAEIIYQRNMSPRIASLVRRIQTGVGWNGKIKLPRLDSADREQSRPRKPNRFACELSASPIFDPVGKIVGIVIAFWDITRSRRLERQRRAISNQQAACASLSLLAHSDIPFSELGLHVVRSVKNVLTVDGCSLHQYQPNNAEEVIVATAGRVPLQFHSCTHPKSCFSIEPESIGSLCVPINGNEKPFGRLYIFNQSNRKFEPEELDFVQSISHILSNVIRRNDAMNRWAALFANTLDAIFLINSSGMIVDANATALTMLGCSGKPLADLPRINDLEFGSNNELIKCFQELETSAALTKMAGIDDIRSCDGSVKRVEFVAVASILPGLHMLDMRDITLQTQMEQELRREQSLLAHAQRTSTIGQLAAVLAHEINQPLGAISNYVGGLLLKCSKSPNESAPSLEILEQIQSQAVRAGEVIRRLRNFVSKRAPVAEMVDVNRIVVDTAKLMRNDFRTRQLELILKLQNDLPNVFGDSIQIQQVLVNLLKNASEAMEDQSLASRIATVRTFATDSSVYLVVEDQGPKISDELLGHLFQPYYTTKSQGLGLGLCLSKTIIEQHRGTLHAERIEGGGLRFCITLPCAPVEKGHLETTAEHMAADSTP